MKRVLVNVSNPCLFMHNLIGFPKRISEGLALIFFKKKVNLGDKPFHLLMPVSSQWRFFACGNSTKANILEGPPDPKKRKIAKKIMMSLFTLSLDNKTIVRLCSSITFVCRDRQNLLEFRVNDRKLLTHLI